jgi:hypothetical protein
MAMGQADSMTGTAVAKVVMWMGKASLLQASHDPFSKGRRGNGLIILPGQEQNRPTDALNRNLCCIRNRAIRQHPEEYRRDRNRLSRPL